LGVGVVKTAVLRPSLSANQFASVASVLSFFAPWTPNGSRRMVALL
jgi:hypothetical protein